MRRMKLYRATMYLQAHTRYTYHHTQSHIGTIGVLHNMTHIDTPGQSKQRKQAAKVLPPTLQVGYQRNKSI